MPTPNLPFTLEELELHHGPKRLTKQDLSISELEALQPKLGFAPLSTVKETLNQTTRFYKTPGDGVARRPMRDHWKTRFPAYNVKRRHEPVATDWIYSDTPAIDDGSLGAQLFIGCKSLVADVFGAKTDAQYVNHLEDVIRKRGAMDSIVSDRGSSIISQKAKDIYRMLFIDTWQSEPDHQNQNPFERRFQTVKRWTNNVMNRTGAPAYTWLLALIYVCMILNVLASPALGGQVPLTVLTGEVQDISPYLQFHFYEPVYVKRSKHHFPSESEEVKGRWVGFAEGI